MDMIGCLQPYSGQVHHHDKADCWGLTEMAVIVLTTFVNCIMFKENYIILI